MSVEYRNYAFNRGIVMGFALCLITIFFYFFDYNLLFQGRIHAVSFFIVFSLFPILIVLQKTISMSTFKDYFSVLFLILATSSLVYTFFTYLLFNSLSENVVGVYGLLPSLLILPEDGLELGFPVNDFSIFSQLNSYIFWLMPCTLFSSIISLLMKRIN